MTIAFWCVLVAAILPYVPFSFAAGAVDQRAPRKAVAQLEGLPARAHGAHLNAFEAFPPFAAAVIISHLAIGANSLANGLAITFIIVRVAHMGFYLGDRPPLRSAAFFVGLIIDIVIFVHAAL